MGEALLASAAIEPQRDEAFFGFLRRMLAQPGSAVFVRKASGWVRTAKLRHVLTWMLPSESAWADVPEVKDPEGEPCESKWLADRFLLTFVRDWSTLSLHQEHRWQRGEASCDVDPAEIGLRVVSDGKLNAAIALRAVTGESAEYQRALLSRAVELVGARQFTEAAAMFEGALTVAPTPWSATVSRSASFRWNRLWPLRCFSSCWRGVRCSASQSQPRCSQSRGGRPGGRLDTCGRGSGVP